MIKCAAVVDWDKASVSIEKIDDLVFSWRLYPRMEINQTVVKKYADALQAGSIFPPVKVGVLNGKKIIVDGLHRIRSRQLLKVSYADCASLRFESEAELFAEAVRLNSTHGKGFSEEELKANIKQLKKFKFTVEDIVAFTHVPAAEIYKEFTAPIKVVTAPSGRKIHCNIQKIDCNGQPNARELVQFKNALILIRDVAQKGCIPTDDSFFKELVTQCRLALGKVQFNG